MAEGDGWSDESLELTEIAGESRNHTNYYHASNGSFANKNFMMLKKAAHGPESTVSWGTQKWMGPKEIMPSLISISVTASTVNWQSLSNFLSKGWHLGCHTLWQKGTFFVETSYTGFPTIQFLPFLLRLNEGTNKFGYDENFWDVDICSLTAKTVLYIWVKQQLSADVNNFWSPSTLLDLTRPAACTIKIAHCSLSEKWRAQGKLWPFFVGVGLPWTPQKYPSDFLISRLSLWWKLGRHLLVVWTAWKNNVLCSNYISQHVFQKHFV